MMKTVTCLPLVLLLAACEPAEVPADMVFSGGRVHVMDDVRTIAGAVAVRDGRIVFVGTDRAATAFVGPATERIDMAGGALFPGFTDAHVHIIDGGESLLSLDLAAADSGEEALALVAAWASDHPELAVISGAGWQLTLFPGAAPSKDLLDAIVPDRPVVLFAADGHNAWVNSAALAAAGIDGATPDPLNGRIERDPLTGAPTGTLREAAMDAVQALIPTPDEAELDARMQAGMGYLNALGYTAAIDASVPAGTKEETFRRAAARDRLTLHLQMSLLPGDSLLGRPGETTTEIATLAARREAAVAVGNPLLTAPQVKIFVDGVMENFTAALLEPYIDAPEGTGRGTLNIPAGDLSDFVTALDAAGFQVHFHAIGDAAVRAALDAVAAARTANGVNDRRHHIAHIELIDPVDLVRFREFGVTANAQALWAHADAYITDLTEPFLGAARSQYLYPFAGLLKAGATLASGSDWPVSTADPMAATEVAVTRHDPDLGEGAAWHPEQAITVDAMLAALTRGGARLMHQEAERGTIEVGKAADLVLLDHDPYEMPPGSISEIRARLTLLAGKTVHRAP